MGSLHPQIEHHMRAFGTPEQYELCTAFLLHDSTAIVHQDGRVETRGDIWDKILDTYEHYHQLESPSLEDYRLLIDVWAGRPIISAHTGDEQWDVCSDG